MIKYRNIAYNSSIKDAKRRQKTPNFDVISDIFIYTYICIYVYICVYIYLFIIKQNLYSDVKLFTKYKQRYSKDIVRFVDIEQDK
jgi:hypothetical protein